MASAMRKMAVYLGLVEDDHRYDDPYTDEYGERTTITPTMSPSMPSTPSVMTRTPHAAEHRARRQPDRATAPRPPP